MLSTNPEHSAFQAYIPGSPRGMFLDDPDTRGGPPQKQRRHPPPLPTCTYNLSVGLLETYRRTNPAFAYFGSIQNPRRILTKDTRPGGNHGMDNKSSDLILTVGDVLSAANGGHRFRVLDMLGQGTFGQVVKCRAEWVQEEEISSDEEEEDVPPPLPTSHMVAVKIVKNKPAYYNQAKIEIKVLHKISEELGDGTDPNKPGYSLIRLLYDFEYHHHLCMVFELMSVNLYELIKHQEFRGLPFVRVRAFCTQLLDALECLCQLGVIHCDLKPENILLENFGDPTTPKIKLIDLGSACYRDHVAFTYIQSRFYRAPEVLLGLKYSSPIDLWSLGCVAIELFMGLPVFPGVSAHNQLARVVEMIGMPPNWMIEEGKKGDTYFVQISKSTLPEDEVVDVEFDLKEDYFVTNRKHSSSSVEEPANKKGGEKSQVNPIQWRLKTAAEWAIENNIREGPEKTKRYVKEKTLEGVITKCEAKRRPKNEPVEVLPQRDLECFINFCYGLLKMDPNVRWTAAQAKYHPFITQAKYEGPFDPSVKIETEVPEDDDTNLLFTHPEGQEPPEMEIEIEEDEEDVKADAARRIKTRAAPLQISRPYQTPPSSSATSASASLSKSAGFSQQRSKRKLSEATVGSPSIAGSLTSVLGSPITRPDVPYPLAHQSRWSDLGLLASPAMRPFGLPITSHSNFPPLDINSPNSNNLVGGQFGTSLPTHSIFDSMTGSGEVSAFRRLDFNKQAPTNTNPPPSAAASFWPFPSFSSNNNNNTTTNAPPNNNNSLPFAYDAALLPPVIPENLSGSDSMTSTRFSSSWTSSILPQLDVTLRQRSASDGAPTVVPPPNMQGENTPSVVKSLAKWAPFEQQSEEEKN